jgi:hypothetical protein
MCSLYFRGGRKYFLPSKYYPRYMLHRYDFDTGPERPELEGYQEEAKSKAAQTKPENQIRRICPSGHGSDGSGPK